MNGIDILNSTVNPVNIYLQRALSCKLLENEDSCLRHN